MMSEGVSSSQTFQSSVCKNNTLIGTLTNRLLELIIIEINKSDMQVKIKKQVINPLMYMLYQQLYPYIYAFVIIICLILFMVITLVISFFLFLKRS
jgi:hypothetical protein